MYKMNQLVFTKKPHVCGSNQWKVIRTGIDIKLECVTCKRVIMLSSFELDKRVKPTLSKKELKILEEFESDTNSND